MINNDELSVKYQMNIVQRLTWPYSQECKENCEYSENIEDSQDCICLREIDGCNKENEND